MSERCWPKSAPVSGRGARRSILYDRARRCIPITRSVGRCSKAVIPASTSNLHQRFTRAGQTIELQVMAAVPGAGLTVKHETFTPSYKISPVLRLQPGAERRRLPLRARPDRGSARGGEGPLDPRGRAPRARCGANGRSSSKLTLLSSGSSRPARRRRRKPRQRGQGAGLSERSRRRSRLQRSVAVAFQGRRRRPRSSRHAHRQALPSTDLRIEINTISLATNGKTKREVIRGPDRRCSTAGSPR